MRVTIDTDEKTIRPEEPATLAELAKLEGILRVHYGDGEWRIVDSGPMRAWDWPGVEGQPVPMPTVPMPPYPIQMPTHPGFGTPLPGTFTVPYHPGICGTTLTVGDNVVSPAIVTVAAAWDGQNIVATNAA